MRKGKGDHEDSRDNWMPVLEQSCMELIERQRDGEPDRGPGPDKVGANKRHRRISVRGGGIRTKN